MERVGKDEGFAVVLLAYRGGLGERGEVVGTKAGVELARRGVGQHRGAGQGRLHDDNPAAVVTMRRQKGCGLERK